MFLNFFALGLRLLNYSYVSKVQFRLKIKRNVVVVLLHHKAEQKKWNRIIRGQSFMILGTGAGYNLGGGMKLFTERLVV